jgi:hypothetical protein
MLQAARKSSPSLALIAVMTIVTAGVLAALVVLWATRDSHSQVVSQQIAPVEFVYLDEQALDASLSKAGIGTADKEGQGALVPAAFAPSVAGDHFPPWLSWVNPVRPSGAIGFVALRTALLGKGQLHEIGLRYYKKTVKDLPDGAFVTFQTTALVRPSYLRPFLSTREFLLRGASHVRGDRQSALEEFAANLGPEPRATLALRPAGGEGGRSDGPDYLMPLENAALLSRELSLFSDGGGQLAVLGLIFHPGPERAVKTAHFVDRFTRQTWGPLLRETPLQLLCGGNSRCRKIAPSTYVEALRNQTRIDGQGAVILPIAIYR